MTDPARDATDAAALLALVADIPRHVELRWYLRRGGCRVTGFAADGPSAVVDAGDGTLFVVGEPPPGAVRAALAAGTIDEVIAPSALGDRLAPLVPGWARSLITVHRLSPRAALADDGAVRLLDPATLPALGLPDELLAEMGEAVDVAEIAATFVDGAPVSFAYAGAVTEGWWDVSIDTLEAHRQRGHAAACVSWLIRRERARGREPVWQSVTENPASWRLAQKLGFEGCDGLAFFERPAGGAGPGDAGASGAG